MRLALPLAILALAAALLAGCGGSSDAGRSTGLEATAPASEGGAEAPAGASATSCGDSLKATGVPCGKAKAIHAAWSAAPGCAGSPGESHPSCRVRGYLCIGATVQRGMAVSCALPGRSVVFIEPR